MMFSYDEFKEHFKNEIEDLYLTEDQIRYNYDVYLEDPMQFSGSMITGDSFCCTVPDCPHCAYDESQFEEDERLVICPNCGEEENLHFNYDYALPDMPIINIVCNECKTIFEY